MKLWEGVVIIIIVVVVLFFVVTKMVGLLHLD
jgi:hypothetical protein